MTDFFKLAVCLLHIRKALDRFCETFDSFIRVSVLYSVAHAMLDMSLKHDFSAAVQRGFRSVYLRQNIFAGHVLVDHTLDSLNLSYNFFQSAMQIIGIHTLFHSNRSLSVRYIIYYSFKPLDCQYVYRNVRLKRGKRLRGLSRS